MSELPFKQVPRRGQREVIQRAVEPNRRRLCVQLPTGYGKTFTAAAVYSQLKAKGLVDRLLYLVPTKAQLDQFVQDGPADLDTACVSGTHYVCDVAYTGAAQTIKQHRTGSHQVFATTIQSLTMAGTGSIVRELMRGGRWMICVDEYHHYGVDKTWGRSVLVFEELPSCQFLLALSATPYRPGDDSAFGKPEIIWPYQRAVREQAVKPMRCHGYTYRIDAIDNGDVVSYTTEALIEEAGSDSPEALERIFRQMRWSPKYISPLVDIPITRMQRERIATGYKLQAIIGAFCCSHAQMVCEQVQGMFPELRVDWVGTGTNGRTDAENRAILSRFCPPKRDGKRHQEDIKLDVLVHVGMAGEGLDTLYVSEVIHLNPANKNNSNDQENGRAARYLSDVTAYVNVETGSDYARDYLGSLIELAFDTNPGELPEQPEGEVEQEPAGDEIPELPDEPTIQIVNCECIEINTGEVERMAAALSEVSGVCLEDPVLQEKAFELYKRMKLEEAERFNDRSAVEQWRDAVEQALSVVARRAAQLMTAPGARMDRSLLGDLRKRINTRKKRVHGPVDRDVQLLRQHYNWLKALESELIEGGVPSWLQ
jgi:superfamily II DNA or RNA helicase